MQLHEPRSRCSVRLATMPGPSVTASFQGRYLFLCQAWQVQLCSQTWSEEADLALTEPVQSSQTRWNDVSRLSRECLVR